MEDEARDWFETNIRNKNWELTNILDNVGLANGAAFTAANNAAIQALPQNQLRGPALAVRNGAASDATINGNTLVPAPTVWDEDWSVAGGQLTHLAQNPGNANTGANIVFPGLKAGQVIYEFLHSYPTITSEKSKVAFQNIIQGTDSVG